MKVLVQEEDFSLQQEADLLRAQSNGTGAIVSFTGLVRDYHQSDVVEALYLEHYPGMTEKSLYAILEEAASRWPLLDATVIHRIGELKAGEQIVMVVVSSAHRKAAFDACEFVMDYLKTKAPFWKKTRSSEGDFWVDAKEGDDQAADRWNK